MGHDRDLIRFLKYVEKTDACWLWTGARLPRGYGRFYFEGKPRYAHRVSMTLFRGEHPPVSHEVMHRCDNPQCVNPEHLQVGTQAENMQDASRKGRIVVRSNWAGTGNPKAKLSADQRLALEAQIRAGLPTKEIAATFGVTDVRVGQIARAKKAGGGWDREEFA